MGKEIQKLIEIATGLLNYAAENKGTLDEKGRAELKAMLSRLAELATGRHDLKETLSLAQTQLENEVTQFKQILLKSRRLLDAASVGSKAGSKTPRSFNGMFAASRIHTVAVGHKQELEKIAGDPSITKVLVSLDGSMASFDAAYARVRSAHGNRRDLNGGHKEELAVIAGKLAGYKIFAKFNVPSAQRKALQRLMRDLVPAKAQRRQAAATAAAAPDAQPTTLPQLPAAPTTVPQTGDHPVMSASA